MLLQGNLYNVSNGLYVFTLMLATGYICGLSKLIGISVARCMFG